MTSALSRDSLYKTLFDMANDIMLFHEFVTEGHRGRFLDVNRKACEALGYTKAEMLGMSPLDLIDEPQKAVVPEETEELHQQGSLLFEKELITKSGGRIPVEIHAHMIEQDGETTVLSIARDISHRRKQEKRISALLDSSLDAVALLKKDGEIIDVNKETAARFGVTAREMIGNIIYDYFPEEVAKRRRKAVEQVFETGKAARTEDVRDGIWNDNIISPVLERDGKVEMAVVTARNITERKAAEYEQMKLSTIVERSGEFIGMADTCGNVVYLNRAAREMVGLEKEEALETTIFDYVPDEEKTKISDEALPEVMKNGSWTGRGLLKHFRTGENIDVEITVFFMEHVNRLAVIMRDIRDRIQAESAREQMFEHEKMAAIGRVAGKMAHDFNNVVGITMGISELLLLKDLPADIAPDIRAIKDSAERGRELTRNLLLFARDREIRFSYLDLNERITSILKALRTQIEGVRVNIVYGADCDRIIADPGLLENSIINLVQNAIHAMSKAQSPRLTIRTAHAGDNIVIEISDNGCGIPADVRDNIFEPSFTLKGSMDSTGAYRRGIKGSGYGLANVKRAIEKHGGSISFDSEPGRGTTFRIEIPVIEASLKPEEARRIDENSVVRGKRILVVEDEVPFGNVLYKLLRSYDHEVSIAGTGRKAIDMAAAGSFDLISLDFILPDMNGLDVYREIRKNAPHTPVIFVSGNFEFMQSMIGLKKDDPNVDHIAKPFNNSEYLKMINQWLI